MKVNVLCDACQKDFSFPIEEEQSLFDSKRLFIRSACGRSQRWYICDQCYKDNFKFNEHGVLMNETPIKKKKKSEG